MACVFRDALIRSAQRSASAAPRSAVSCKPCYGPPGKQQAQLDGLRSCQLQDRACQITVGKSQLIQNREVVCMYDRNQATGEMSLSPVSMEIPTASDHRRQLTRAIGDGQWFIDARQAHWRKGYDLDFRQLYFIVHVGGVAQRSKFEYARNRQPCPHSWMIQEECREMPTGRPTREYDGPRNTMSAGLRGEPVKRGSQLFRDLRQARVRG